MRCVATLYRTLHAVGVAARSVAMSVWLGGERSRGLRVASTVPSVPMGRLGRIETEQEQGDTGSDE